jgi:hypothetical protein
VAVLCLAAVVSSCGGSISSAAQIRRNFARLLTAFHDHDARTVCELLFPFGQHQQPGALTADLRRLETPAGQSRYRAYVTRCAPDFARDPRNFTAYAKGFAGVSIGPVTVHGDTAEVRTTFKTGAVANERFVNAAGEWRLLVGVQ